MPLKDPKARQEYHRNYMRDRLASDLEFKRKHLVRVGKNRALYKANADEVIAEFRKNGCLFCPERTPCCLTAHHLEPDEKDFDLGKGRAQGFCAKRIADELSKCVCLCFNCHAKVHAGITLDPEKALVQDASCGVAQSGSAQGS